MNAPHFFIVGTQESVDLSLVREERRIGHPGSVIWNHATIFSVYEFDDPVDKVAEIG
jgi:hypothetical protein